MSRAFSQVGPGHLEVREGGGCLAVFGLPFLIAGICVSLISLGLFPLQNSGQLPWFGRPMLLLMGVIFTLVGGTLVFGRSWTKVDATGRTIVKQMGLLVPMSTATHRLDDYASVLLDFQRGDSDSADQFPVSLKARTGKNLRLFSSTQYAEARQRATAIASLLRFDIEDRSTDHPVRLSAAQADLSLQHRMRLEHRSDEMVVRPANMRSEMSVTNDSVRIVVPAAQVHPALFLFFLIPVAVPIFFFTPFLRFFQQSNTPDAISWIFLGFLTVAFGLPTMMGVKAFLRTRFGRTTVTASPGGIRIEERRVWKTRPLASFDAADIMDIDYSTSGTLLIAAKQDYEQRIAHEGDLAAQPRPSTTLGASRAASRDAVDPRLERVLGAIARIANRSSVTIKTRQGLTTFGEGLSDDEIRYLHSVVRRAIVDGSMT